MYKLQHKILPREFLKADKFQRGCLLRDGELDTAQIYKQLKKYIFQIFSTIHSKTVKSKLSDPWKLVYGVKLKLSKYMASKFETNFFLCFIQNTGNLSFYSIIPIKITNKVSKIIFRANLCYTEFNTIFVDYMPNFFIKEERQHIVKGNP